MGFLPVLASVIAGTIFYGRADTKLMWAAIVAGVFALWTLGIMHNFAVEAARRRETYKGGFGDFSVEEAGSVPNGLALANMASSLCAFILFVVAIVRTLI